MDSLGRAIEGKQKKAGERERRKQYTRYMTGEMGTVKKARGKFRRKR